MFLDPKKIQRLICPERSSAQNRLAQTAFMCSERSSGAPNVRIHHFPSARCAVEPRYLHNAARRSAESLPCCVRSRAELAGLTKKRSRTNVKTGTWSCITPGRCTQVIRIRYESDSRFNHSTEFIAAFHKGVSSFSSFESPKFQGV